MKKRMLLIAGISLLCLVSANAEGLASNSQDTVKTITRTITIDSKTGDTIDVASQTKTIVSTKEESNVLFGGASYNLIFSWKKKKRLSPHWTGIGMGFMNYDDANIPNGKLKISTSHNFTLNLIDYNKQISNSNWLLVSGVGMEFSRYHFDTNAALTKVNGITTFVPAPNGIDYTSNKLLAYYITLPLLFEYQTSHFHVSGGPVAFFKYYSKSEVEYTQNNRKEKESMGRDLNIRPVDLKLRLQVGIDDVAIYGYYSPFSMFNKNEGPDLKTYTVGVMIGI
ncbi:MAG: hypothetical protein BGN96_17695 [Bacteroidales bacterium 45-6]|nr:MAG: hypothetical protein BGN96_17695 [Bacteroidales bacterium 45-6]